MSVFYACPSKHVKKNNEEFSLLCLLGHAIIATIVKKINKAAQMLSKLGASKGGKARAAKLTPEQRKAIAEKAAKARWATTHQKGV